MSSPSLASRTVAPSRRTLLALLLPLLGALAFTPAQAEISQKCLDIYIGTGAVPVGPDATFQELLQCQTTALNFHRNMGNYDCKNSAKIDEYCHLPKPDDEDEDKEKDDCNDEGNPCNPTSGNKHQTETDYRSYDGRLSLVRHYHSLNPTDGPFGYGWSGTNQARLAIESADTLRIHQASGRAEPWNLVNGQWQGDPDSRLSLQADGDGYLLTNPDLSIEHYDAQGRLTNRTERGGLTTGYTYDSAGRLESVTGPFGRTLAYSYGADGHIEGIATPDGALSYAYDTQGNLISVGYPDGVTRQYHYEDPALPHHLTGLSDERGERFASWSYQADGRVISSEHAGGVERVEFSYSDNATQVDGALGDSRSYSHQLLHGVRKITEVTGDRCATCPNGGLQSRSYDADGFLIGYFDWNGNETRLTRNARHLIESRTEAVGMPEERTTTTEWDPNFELPVRIAEPKRTTELSYDSASHRLLSRRLIDNATGVSRTTSYSYNAQGLLASIDGPREDVADIITYEYDSAGNLIAVTNPLGQISRITAHDPSGRPLILVDPNGLATELSYDARGRLITQILSDGAAARTTSYSYDAAGNLTQVRQPDGSQLTLEYDAAQRLIGLVDGEGNRIGYTLDAMGHTLEARVSDPMGTLRQSYQQVYSRLGRLIQSIDAQNNASDYGYDGNDNLIHYTDARQNPTQSAYDALDRLQQRTDSLGGVTQYSYDAQGRLTGVTDPNGLSTGYDYDGLDNLTTRNSPDTGLTTYTYDAAGNRVGQTDSRGVIVSYSYDALNRLSAVNYPDSALNVSYIYDQGANGLGRLSAMSDTDGTTNYRYNAFGELTGKSRTTNDGLLIEFSFSYDNSGRLIEQSYPSGRRLSYAYDPQGRIERITLQEAAGGATQVLAHNIQRLPFGPIHAFDYGNGLHLQRQYDQNYRLIEQSIPGILQSHYQYDPVGNIAQWQDLLDAGRDQHFDYDALDRLISASGVYGALGYGYDATGNRLSLSEGSQSTSYSYAAGSHRLLEILGSVTDSRSYDEAGNTLQSLVGAYSYDAGNRLSGFSNGTLEASYVYNGQGQRILKRISRDGGAGEYLALAEAAEQQAQAYRASADLLEGEAQSAETEAVRLTGEADTAETSATQRRQEAAGLTLAAELTARLADAEEQLAATLRQMAADYRAKIKSEPAGFWEELQNALYERVAENAEAQALKADAKAVELQAKAEDLSAQAQARQAEADALSQQAANLRQQAESLNTQVTQQREEAQAQRQLAADADAQAAEYRRLAEQGGPSTQSTQRFAYDEQGLLIGEYDETGTPVREYVYLEGEPLALLSGNAQSQSEAVYYLHTDHLGAVIKASDANQGLVWDAERKPFGERSVTTGQIEMPLGFAGQYFDEESGNYYNYFRDYDPTTGRYLQSDPIGLQGGLNTYTYVGNNPLVYTDLLGLARFGYRPLDSLGFIPYLGANSYDNRNNTEWVHEQLWFDDAVQNPNLRENIGFFGDNGMFNETGRVRPDVGHNRGEFTFRGPNYDDAIMRQALKNIEKLWDGSNYNVANKNCQDFADALRKEYIRLLNP